ncbi:transposase, partial [Vibrio sp. S11_S32]|nr:transposase [Vibrio sp. S11_S32]
DTVINCLPENSCACCGSSDIQIDKAPYYRHQVHEIPEPIVDITEYRLFNGHCTHCNEKMKPVTPKSMPQGIIGPNLLSYIAILSGQYHLSIRKIRSLLKEQLGTTFSIGTISEAQTKVASMLTVTHQAVKLALQKSPLIHVDETSHSRNDEDGLRWCWLMASILV